MDWTGENGIASFLREIYGAATEENAEFVDAVESDEPYTNNAWHPEHPCTNVVVTIRLIVPIPTKVWDSV